MFNLLAVAGLILLFVVMSYQPYRVAQLIMDRRSGICAIVWTWEYIGSPIHGGYDWVEYTTFRRLVWSMWVELSSNFQQS